jgi:hypothetical protein
MKALFCRNKSLFWSITGNASLERKKVAENSRFVGVLELLMAAENLFRGAK